MLEFNLQVVRVCCCCDLNNLKCELQPQRITKMNALKTSRRDFLKTTTATAGAVAFGGLIPSTVLGANDRTNFGVIGCGGMGTGHLGSLVKRSDADNIKVQAVSDVYQRRLMRAKGICHGEGYPDYRKLLERK